MRIYLSRWVSQDVETNLRRLQEEAAEAAAGGAEVVVFPESFLHGYTRTVDPDAVRRTFAATSEHDPDTLFVFGSSTDEGRNRMTVWTRGRQVAAYDKVHLFPPNREEEIWTPGDSYVAVRRAGVTIGLVNCNDIRFPEQARALRLEARCDILVAVAWWPWRRDHVWSALLKARAIENAVWTAGCCVAASEVPGERFAGAGNHVFDPLGEPVRSDDDRFWDLDPARRRAVLIDPLETYRDVRKLQVFEAD